MPTTIKLETWEEVSPPALPASWVGGDPGIVTAATGAFAGTNCAVAPTGSNGSGGQETLVWGDSSGNITDSRVSAYLRSETTGKINYQVMTRFQGGSGASTSLTGASCYLAEISLNSGPGLLVVRFNGGTPTVLSGGGSPLFPSAFSNGIWYYMSLAVVGAVVTVQVQRQDTSQWLNSSGTWVTDGTGATVAYTTTDGTPLSTSGYSGFGFYQNIGAFDVPARADNWKLENMSGGGGTTLLAPTCIVTQASTTSLNINCTPATGGTATFSYQLQKSTDGSSFSNLGSAQTGITAGVAPTQVVDTGLTTGTILYYRWQVTDSAGSPATVTTNIHSFAPHTSPATYYVDPAGSDSNNGTATGTAWQTLAHASNFGLNAGDTLLLKGGVNHSGSLFYIGVAGTPASPLTIGAYGTGTPTILCSNSWGIRLVNCSGVKLSGLVVHGSGAFSNGTSTNLYNGVEVINANFTGHLDHIYIDNLEVTGCYSGIEVRGSATAGTGTSSGFNDVRVTNCYVHDVLYFGVQTRGLVLLDSSGNALTWNSFSLVNDRASSSNNYQLFKGTPFNGVYIGNCKVLHSYGDPARNDNTHSGDGIMVKQTVNGVVDRCSAFHCGAQGYGPAGIWTQESNNVVIRHCEVAYQGSSVTVDGDGFDMDGGTVNCIIEHCYSHNNQGAGYLCGPYTGAAAPSGCVIRYSFSVNDATGPTNAVSAVYPYGNAQLDIYNCLFYADNTAAALTALVVHGGGQQRMWNNIFLTNTTAAIPFVSGTFNNGSLALGNLYNAYQANPKWTWNGTSYTTLSTFISGASQETLNGVTVGLNADPLLVNPGDVSQVMPANQATHLQSYDQTASSPTINAALDLLTIYGIDPGRIDFHGLENRASASLVGSGFDIGPTKYGNTTLSPAVSLAQSRQVSNPIANGTAGSSRFLFAARRTGLPLTSLTPTWVALYRLSDGASILGSAPAISAVANGQYKFDYDTTVPAAGVIDLGAAFSNSGDRYLPVALRPAANQTHVFYAASAGVAATGLTPTWLMFKRRADGVTLSFPTITELGFGLYDFPYNQATPASGQLDLGTTVPDPADRYIDIACIG